VAGTIHRLPEPFFVQACEDSWLEEQTFPLSAEQKDRFLLKVVIDSPNEEDWSNLSRAIAIEYPNTERPHPPPVPRQVVLDAQAEVRSVAVSSAVERYVETLIDSTWRTGGDEPGKWIHSGASSRGSEALIRCARARAWLLGRNEALIEDVRGVAPGCLRHRIVLTAEAQDNGVQIDQIITQLLTSV
jgi:MoxR-like ATPase